MTGTAFGFNAFFAFGSTVRERMVSVDLPVTVTIIAPTAFNGFTDLIDIRMPTGVTSIGNSAFANCANLTLTSLPAGLITIGAQVFQNCTSLTSIELQANVTSIGNSAFLNCNSLTEVTIHATTPPTLGTTVFNNTHPSLQIKVPAASVAAYRAAWGALLPAPGESRIVGF